MSGTTEAAKEVRAERDPRLAAIDFDQAPFVIAAVDPQGRFHPDQFSWHVEAGDMRRQRFAEIWRDDNLVLAAYRQRPRRLRGRCERCRFAPLCNGGLPVRAESATGDPWAPDPPAT